MWAEIESQLALQAEIELDNSRGHLALYSTRFIAFLI
jgi:hypothetical protein